MPSRRRQNGLKNKTLTNRRGKLLAAVYSQHINTVVIIKTLKKSKKFRENFLSMEIESCYRNYNNKQIAVYESFCIFLYWNNTQLVFFVEISKPIVLFNS